MKNYLNIVYFNFENFDIFLLKIRFIRSYQLLLKFL